MKQNPTTTTSAIKPPRLGAKGEALKQQRRDLRPIRRLLPFVFRYRWRVVAVVCFLLISSVAALVIPSIAGQLIDKGFLTQNIEMVGQYGMLAIAVAALMALGAAGRFYFMSILGERVLTDLRRKVFDHLLLLDTTFFDLHRVGELTSRLNGDVATIRGALTATLSMTLRNIVTLIGAVSLMFLTSPYMTLTIIVAGPAIVVPIVMFARRLRRQSRYTTDTMAEMSAMATEALGATRTIKSFVQEEEQSATYGQRAEDSYRAEVSRLGTRATLLGAMTFLATAVLVVLIWWGSKAVFDGVVTPGELTQFMIYALMASNALTNLSEVLGTVQTVAGRPRGWWKFSTPNRGSPPRPIR